MLFGLLHHFGFWMLFCAFIAYIFLRYKRKDFLTEGYRLYFRRRFTGLGIFGFTLIFGSGMALIITGGYAGSKNFTYIFGIKFLCTLVLLIISLCVWGIDVGIVKRIEELKSEKTEVEIEYMDKRIGRLNRMMNVFAIFGLLLSLFIFVYSYLFLNGS